jgi:hypothetical protein
MGAELQNKRDNGMSADPNADATLTWTLGVGMDEVVKREAPIDPVYNGSGVYIWVVALPVGGELLSYVGRATGSPTLWQRMRQHYSMQIGGGYMMPAEFIPEDYLPDMGYWAVDWRSASVRQTLADEQRFLSIVHAGFEFVKKTTIYVAAVAREAVRDVERHLLYDLQPVHTTPGTKSQPADRVRINHSNVPWMSESIKAHLHRSLAAQGRSFADAGLPAD